MNLCLRLVCVALPLLVAAPALAQYDYRLGGKNKVRYDTFDWKVYETPHFRISYYDRVEPTLPRVASFAESAYDELARKLNFQILEPIPMLTYATHAEFEQTNVIVGFIPEGVGAFATPVRNRMVLPVDLSDADLQALIQHELVHIFQYEILYQGKVRRALYRRPPLWFMEGMASYLAFDESARERAYMRDAALADRIPSIAQPPGGYMAYRYGHKVFEFIESEWGEDGLREFIFSFRNTLGGRVAGPFAETFNMDAEDFDAAFRSWLRRHYGQFAERGTPEEFARRFRTGDDRWSNETSPAVSPSGDLVAAFTTVRNDVDVALLGVPDRRLYKNLTPGETTRYQYLIAQGLTVGPDRGRDLAFSPDGNRVAVFARFDRTRKLLLLDAVKGGVAAEHDIPLPVDQPMQPAFSPDGRSVAFRGYRGGQADIYLLDLGDGSIVNLTDDETYDTAPSFAPDGNTLVYSARVGQWDKLVELQLDDPTRRRQFTFGDGNDEGAAFSRDGRRVFFASDRENGILDVYQYDLESRSLSRLTHLIGAAVNPVPVQTLDGERVVFQAYSRGAWQLWVADPAKAVPVGTQEPPREGVEVEPYVPAVTIPVDPTKGTVVKRHRLFMEDARAFIGYDRYGALQSQVYFGFSDQYGDRRLDVYLSSVDTFSNFNATWLNLEPRLQWGALLSDYRTFYVWGYDPLFDDYTDREQAYRQTGGAFLAQYPFSRSYRVSGSVGYVDQSVTYPMYDDLGNFQEFVSYRDHVPFANVGLAGDTTRWQAYGPHRGTRWELDFYYGADLEDGGALSANTVFEGRAYLPLSQRNEVAVRLYAAFAEGNRPSIFAFGGMDTIRGLPIRSISGNRGGFVNVEWRFPLIDTLDLAFLRLSNIRGVLFVDVGTAWWDFDGVEYNYRGEPGFDFIEDGRLKDGVASYGFGVDLYFFGLPMHWDFSKRWDFKDTLGRLETDFWIGFRF